jgi:hypothetical protein
VAVVVVFIGGEDDRKALTLASLVSKHPRCAWGRTRRRRRAPGPERREIARPGEKR